MGLIPVLPGKSHREDPIGLCLHWSWRLGGAERCLAGDSGCREKLASMGNLSSEMSKKGFVAVDLSSAFLKTDGSAMDLTKRLSPEFELN